MKPVFTSSLCVVSFAAAALLSGTVAAVAEESPLWAEVGGWDVRIDRTLNDGCFAIAYYEGGSVFRIGLNMIDRSGYVVVGNTNWKSLEEGKEYDIRFQFGNEEPWDAVAEVFAGKNLMARFEDPDFLHEFAKKHTVRVFYRNKEIAGLKLKGSYKALREVLSCQEAITEASNSGPDKRRDPFRPDRVSPATDPFAY